MNDTKRAEYVNQFEELTVMYKHWKKNRHKAYRHIRLYVRENRAMIDEAVKVLTAAPEPR